MAYPITQMILIMDDPVPQHIRQTFLLNKGARGWESDLSAVHVAVEGDDIDMSAGGYVVIYASNDWHSRAAINLYEQIKSLRKDAVVVMLPVEVEVKEEEEDETHRMLRLAVQGGTFTLPTFP